MKNFIKLIKNIIEIMRLCFILIVFCAGYLINLWKVVVQLMFVFQSAALLFSMYVYVYIDYELILGDKTILFSYLAVLQLFLYLHLWFVYRIVVKNHRITDDRFNFGWIKTHGDKFILVVLHIVLVFLGHLFPLVYVLEFFNILTPNCHIIIHYYWLDVTFYWLMFSIWLGSSLYLLPRALRPLSMHYYYILYFTVSLLIGLFSSGVPF